MSYKVEFWPSGRGGGLINPMLALSPSILVTCPKKWWFFSTGNLVSPVAYSGYLCRGTWPNTSSTCRKPRSLERYSSGECRKETSRSGASFCDGRCNSNQHLGYFTNNSLVSLFCRLFGYCSFYHRQHQPLIPNLYPLGVLISEGLGALQNQDWKFNKILQTTNHSGTLVQYSSVFVIHGVEKTWCLREPPTTSFMSPHDIIFTSI